jgi:transcriptional regulator with XRE-family HTH domain
MTDQPNADVVMERRQDSRPAAGEHLKKLRIRLGISTRDVEAYSQQIARNEASENFRTSNAWLTQLENRIFVPSFHKLFSLSIIYRVSISELLSLFGVNLSRVNQYQFPKTLEKTHLAHAGDPAANRTLQFPVQSNVNATGETTGLLSRVIDVSGEVPVRFIENLNLRRSQYGFIGLEDRTMYLLLRPGAFVQIDPNAKSIDRGPWESELDRPPTSSSFTTVTRARGAKCKTDTSYSFPTRLLLCRFGDANIRKKLRLSAG